MSIWQDRTIQAESHAIIKEDYGEVYDDLRFAGVRHLGKGLGMLLFRAISVFYLFISSYFSTRN